MLSEEQLGVVLRDRLRAVTDDLQPSEALLARVAEIGGRSRRRRVRPLLALVPAGALAVGALIVALVLGVGATTPTQAFAGWTPIPMRVSGSPWALAKRTCGPDQPVTASRVRVVDVRGPYTSVIFAMPEGAGYCIRGMGIYDGGTSGASGSVVPDEVQTFPIQFSSGGGSYKALFGRVGTAVTGVSLSRRAGGPIEATIEHGWYLLWWPSRVKVGSLIVASGAHRRVYQLPAAVRITSACGTVPGHPRQDAACAMSGPSVPPRGMPTGHGSGIDKSALGPNPPIPRMAPMIDGWETWRPYRSTLLLQVRFARRVSACFRVAAAHPVCVKASLLTTLRSLPHGDPIQKDLLYMFPQQIWLVHVPKGAVRGTSLRLSISAQNRGLKSHTGVMTMHWPPGPIHGLLA